MDNNVRARALLALSLSAIAAAGCSPNNDALRGYTVSGTVSGLASGQQVTLADNGGATLNVTKNGSFTFGAGVPYGNTYSVTIAAQPSAENCAVSNGSGASLSYNITNVNILCTSTTYQVGGTITGLGAGASLTLQDNGTDSLTVNVNGNFNFATPLIYNQAYGVTVSAQPTGQTCTVAMGSGTITTSAVSTVAITCAYQLEPVAIVVSGLESNASLRLLLNGGDTLIADANGNYTFTAEDAYSSPFAVTITGTQPPGQTCTVEGGSGIVTGSVIVPIICTDNLYTIGGVITGLAPFQQVVLTDNSSDTLTVTANGTFTFNKSLFYQAKYNVQVNTQPTGENCTVQTGTGSGTVMTASVTSVVVTCLTTRSQNAYAVNSGVPNVALLNMNAGQLTASPSANQSAATGSNPLSIAIDPTFSYAYVVNQGDGPPSDISEYVISSVDGSLSPLSDSPIAAGNGAQFVAVSPLDNAVYALNGIDGTISQYTLGTGTGILAPMATPTVATGSLSSPTPNPIAMAINSTGTFAYVVNQGDNSLSEFSITSGALTLVTTTSTGNGPNAVAISPNGMYLYVTNATDNTISEFGISAGSLALLPESPIVTNTGGSPTSVVVDPTNTYVYVADNSPNIDEYTITGDGSLSPNANAAANGGNAWIGTSATANQLAFDQTGAFLFSADNNGNVDQFALTPLAGVLVSEGTYSSPSGGNATSLATAFPPQ